MSMRLRFSKIIFYILIMSLKNALSFIIKQKTNHTSALIETLKNSVKQAHTQERIIFLLECKKASIVPNFIQSATKNARKISKNDGFQKKVDRFSMTALNEALQDAFRHRAFLWRQKQRLMKEASCIKHPLMQWTLREAKLLFWKTVEQDRRRLQKKYINISQGHPRRDKQRFNKTSTGSRDMSTMHEEHGTFMNGCETSGHRPNEQAEKKDGDGDRYKTPSTAPDFNNGGYPSSSSRIVPEFKNGGDLTSTNGAAPDLKNGGGSDIIGIVPDHNNGGGPHSTAGTASDPEYGMGPCSTTKSTLNLKSDGRPNSTTATAHGLKNDGGPLSTARTAPNLYDGGDQHSTIGSASGLRDGGDLHSTAGTASHLENGGVLYNTSRTARVLSDMSRSFMGCDQVSTMQLQRSNRKIDTDLTCQPSFSSNALPVIVSDLNIADREGDVWFDAVEPNQTVTVCISTSVEDDGSLRLAASDRVADNLLSDDSFNECIWFDALDTIVMQHVSLRSNRKTDIDLTCQSSLSGCALPVIVSDLNVADTEGDVWFDSIKPDRDVTMSLSTAVEDDRSLRVDTSDTGADAPLPDDSFNDCIWFDALDASVKQHVSFSECDVPTNKQLLMQTQSTPDSQIRPTLQTPSQHIAPDKNSPVTHTTQTRASLVNPIANPDITAAPHTITQHNAPDRNRVHNLTNSPLPPELSRVLDMGPKFSLSRPIDKRVLEDAEIGFERGAYALRWRFFIESTRTGTRNVTQKDADRISQHTDEEDTPTEPPTSAPLIRPRFPDTDAKMAPAASPPVEHEVRILKQKILTAYRMHKAGPLNHSREEKTALKRAAQDESLIFKQSDKCKGLVVMPKQMYIQKAHSIVAEYEPTPKNPTTKLEAQTKRVIHENMDNAVSEKVVKSIIPNSSRTAELYGLPKNHKENVPLRPIVSACGDPLDKLTWFLERIVTQLLPLIPAHLKNTERYLSALKDKYPALFRKAQSFSPWMSKICMVTYLPKKLSLPYVT